MHALLKLTHAEGARKHQPELDISKRLDNMGSLEMRIADSRVIGAHTRNGDVAFPLGEAFRTDWVGREEEEDGDGPADC